MDYSQGVTLQASRTAIVVARTGEGMQQGNANKAVGKIADYLQVQTCKLQNLSTFTDSVHL